MVLPPDPIRAEEDDVERVKRLSIGRRIAERLEDLGLTAKALSRAIGAGSTYIHDLVGTNEGKTIGKIRNPSRAKLERIARELQCSIEYLEGTIETLYASDRPIWSGGRSELPVLGYVEPDTFRKMTKNQQETRTISYPIHSQYPNAKHFALDVRGADMNAATFRGRAAPIYDGMTVACVDLVSAGVPVENGNIYAVERSLDGGTTAERLLRRAWVFADHVDLVAESTEPDRPAFSIPRENGRTNEVKIIGLVYGLLYDYLR